MVDPEEIRDGIVLHLDPRELVANGATCSAEESLRVRGNHFFLCIAADAGSGNWVPMLTEPGPSRKQVPPNQKRGHPKWVEGTTYYHTKQVWQASHEAVVRAAAAGGDLSRSGSRNSVQEAGVAEVYASLELPAPAA